MDKKGLQIPLNWESKAPRIQSNINTFNKLSHGYLTLKSALVMNCEIFKKKNVVLKPEDNRNVINNRNPSEKIRLKIKKRLEQIN